MWVEARVDDICAAVTRHREAQQPVPPEWYDELCDHLASRASKLRCPRCSSQDVYGNVTHVSDTHQHLHCNGCQLNFSIAL